MVLSFLSPAQPAGLEVFPHGRRYEHRVAATGVLRSHLLDRRASAVPSRSPASYSCGPSLRSRETGRQPHQLGLGVLARDASFPVRRATDGSPRSSSRYPFRSDGRGSQNRDPRYGLVRVTPRGTEPAERSRLRAQSLRHRQEGKSAWRTWHAKAPEVGARCTRAVDVGSLPLDDYLQYRASVSFIKIDTQGAEGIIVEGMLGTLSAQNDLTLVIEFWPYGLGRV